MSSPKGTILLLGGTGKVSSRIAPLLSFAGYNTLLVSRSGTTPSLPNASGVKFDWDNPSTYAAPFSSPISAIFLIAPPIIEMYNPMKSFIDFALSKGVKRFVLLSASLLEVADGPAMGQVSKYLSENAPEWAVLRPSWFMENFSEQQFLAPIRDQDTIITATGAGRVPFVSADDIAAVAFGALTDAVPHNTDHLILGPEMFSYDEVATLLSEKLGREIRHVSISEEEMAKAMVGFGLAEDYAVMLAGLDTAIREGKEERLGDAVFKVTGKQPKTLRVFVDECVGRGVWAKK